MAIRINNNLRRKATMGKWKLRLHLLRHLIVHTFKMGREIVRQDLTEAPLETQAEPPMIVQSNTININNFVGLQEVPIEKIIEASQVIGGENNFKRLLVTAQIYQEMGVEPIFLVNQDQTAIRVAAREIYENPRCLN
jgi:hypothetical protein